MMTQDENAGSSDARNRQGGDIVPVPPRSGELAPESCAGQNTSRVSTAGTRVGLATAEEGPPPSDELTVLFPALKRRPKEARACLREGPRPLGPGEFLGRREQTFQGVVRDTVCTEDLQENGDYRVVETYQFEGWLAGLARAKPYFVQGDPEGRFVRVTLERQKWLDYDRDCRDWGMARDRNPARYGDLPYPTKPGPGFGVEPDSFLPPLQTPVTGLRGGADNDEDSDGGPAGPHRPQPTIVGHEVLTGAQRVRVRRVIPAAVEESDMELDVVGDSSDPSGGDYTDGDSVMEVEPVAGPSKPQKRARGRPRKDGTGPFRPDSPSNEDLVRNAFQGEVPVVDLVDLVPIADRPEVRRAGGKMPKRLETAVPPSGKAPEELEATDLTRWRAEALNRLDVCNNEQAAILALDALDRVEKARGSSKNLKGDISHDLRVSAAVARHAILAMCQRSSRFEMEATASEAVAKLRSECLQLREKTDQLRRELDKQSSGRVYLLKKAQSSREPSPNSALEPCPPKRGQKRDLRERRGEPDPGPPATVVEEAEYDPLIPEIVMGSPARMDGGLADDRPLSPMARFAAADPQVMGVLNDLAESLRGLMRRVEALEGRPPPAPAPHPGEVGAGSGMATPSPITASMRRRMRRNRKGSGRSDPPPTASKKTPRGSGTRARAGPLGPDVATPVRTASGKKGATSVSCVVPPGAAKPTPTKVTLSGARGSAGRGADKGMRKRDGTGGGADPPRRSTIGPWCGDAGPRRRQPERPRLLV